MERITPKRRISGVWIAVLSWIGQRELPVLLSLAAVLAGAWGFIELADEVVEGDSRAFDKAILLALRNPDDHSDPIGPKWVEELGRDFTALGGVGVLATVSLAIAGFLVLQQKKRAALLLVVAVGSGLLASTLLKLGFDRSRPDLVPHGSFVYTSSFPSGHSMLSAVVYLTLGALLARVQSRKRIKAYLLLVAMTLTFLAGSSRVYLGVHWPTDVLAGWTAGTVWALLCWLCARWLQRRGEVESDAEE